MHTHAHVHVHAHGSQVQGMMREEFMKELTRDPVVLHWRGGGGGASDILLKESSEWE